MISCSAQGPVNASRKPKSMSFRLAKSRLRRLLAGYSPAGSHARSRQSGDVVTEGNACGAISCFWASAISAPINIVYFRFSMLITTIRIRTSSQEIPTAFGLGMTSFCVTLCVLSLKLSCADFWGRTLRLAALAQNDILFRNIVRFIITTQLRKCPAGACPRPTFTLHSSVLYSPYWGVLRARNDNSSGDVYV